MRRTRTLTSLGLLPLLFLGAACGKDGGGGGGRQSAATDHRCPVIANLRVTLGQPCTGSPELSGTLEDADLRLHRRRRKPPGRSVTFRATFAFGGTSTLITGTIPSRGVTITGRPRAPSRSRRAFTSGAMRASRRRSWSPTPPGRRRTCCQHGGPAPRRRPAAASRLRAAHLRAAPRLRVREVSVAALSGIARAMRGPTRDRSPKRRGDRSRQPPADGTAREGGVPLRRGRRRA